MHLNHSVTHLSMLVFCWGFISVTSACLQAQPRTCCTAWRIRMLSRKITAVSVPQAFCCVWFVARVHLWLEVIWCRLKAERVSFRPLNITWAHPVTLKPYNSYWADLHWLVMTKISASENTQLKMNFRFWLKLFWRDEIIDKKVTFTALVFVWWCVFTVSVFFMHTTWINFIK